MQSTPYVSLRRRAAILWVAASLSLAAGFGAQNPNLPNFQKVNDHVYRGAQPTDDGFKDLARIGIKVVVDLRLIGEHSQANEEKVVSALGMRYVSIPMKGMSTPKDDKVAAVLTLLNDTAAGPVFVHCRLGADRTGMVIACYRISNDHWENQRALSEAKSYGMHFFERAIKQYVMRYKPRGEVLATDSAGAKTLGAAQ